MNKIYKYVLLLIVFLPVTALAVLINQNGVSTESLSYYILPSIFLVSFLTFILYFIEVFREKSLGDSEKVIWIISFFITTGIAQSIYWIKYLSNK